MRHCEGVKRTHTRLFAIAIACFSVSAYSQEGTLGLGGIRGIVRDSLGFAKFIVTTSGEVDQDRLAIVYATHPGFVEPVRRALVEARYVPAIRGGYPVFQYVQHEFQFVPDASRRPK